MMAERIILYWRDIPAQVIVRQKRVTEKRELPERFIQAIDRCAMSVGAKDSDAYLAEWRRGLPEVCGDDLAAEADAALADLIARYDDARLKALVAKGGRA
jgi:Virulence factor